MKRNRRDWLTGFGTIGVLAVAYLIATPTGRALQLAARGVPVGTPQSEVEAWIGGECDDGIRTFCQIGITFPRDPDGIRRMQEHARAELESHTKASNLYWGPLFAIEFDFAGHETSRFVETRVFPQFRLMGALNALGVVLIGVGVGMLSRLARRAAEDRRRRGRDRKRNWRDWLAGVGAVGVVAVAYLLATTTGRALRLAVHGVPVGTPQAEVEALIGGQCDDGYRTFCQIGITCWPGSRPDRRTLEDMRARTEAGTTACNRYWGPLFAVEFNFAGLETSRFVGARVFPQFRLMGALSALGVLLFGIGIGATSRLARRAADGRGRLGDDGSAERGVENAE